MKKVQVLVFFITALLLLNSCASILNSRYQKITINKENEKDEILINDEVAETKKGKYLFRRDLSPKQITIRSEGFRDQNMVIMAHKKSPLFILSWIPFGLLIYPPFMDNGEKAWNYDSTPLTYSKKPILEAKSADSKEIRINKVSVELEQDSIKSRYFPSYKTYLRKEEKIDVKGLDSGEEINIKNTIFTNVLNKLLKDKGYIDTTNNALKNSYLDNLLINATVNSYAVHHIANRYYSRFGGMVYIDLSVDWEVLDYYENTIYSHTTTSRSSEFAILDYDKKDVVVNKAIKDAMEGGLTEFIKSEKVNHLLYDKSEIEKESTMEEITILKSDSCVSTISQGVKSTLTITSKNGFGSGFIISSDGYIVTNYHVVSNPTDLKVVLNDKSEKEVEVIRVSKIYDLALLKIDAKDLVPYKINPSKDVEIATEIFAVGTPSAQDLSQTISKGIISGIRNTGDTKLIQTDASINNGNSGGPLINKNSEVIGVVSSKLKGFGIEGVAFGIPAYEILEKLKITIE
jgi:S1-C subfamily serine protease